MVAFWTFGSMYVNAAAWLTLSSYGWRFLALLAAVPVAITAAVSFYYLPESPRWLITKGRAAEAERIISLAAVSANHNMEESFSLISTNIKESSYYELISTPNIRKLLIPLSLIWFLFGFTYYGLILYVARIFTNVNGDDDSASCTFEYSAIFVNSTAELLGVVVGAAAIDYLGRRYTQAVFYALAGIFVFSIGLTPSSSLNAISAIAWFARMFSLISNNATWVITPELFHTSVRGSAHSLCNVGARVGAALSPYFAVSSNVSIFFVGFGLFLFNISATGVSLTLPETSG